jgi:PadR family transcriptional regulator PadR
MVRILKQSNALMMREGNIYSILARLQTDGLVASHFEPSQDGPPRRYFELTELGEKTLIEMNALWDQMIESIQTIRKGANKGLRKARNGRV